MPGTTVGTMVGTTVGPSLWAWSVAYSQAQPSPRRLTHTTGTATRITRLRPLPTMRRHPITLRTRIMGMRIRPTGLPTSTAAIIDPLATTLPQSSDLERQLPRGDVGQFLAVIR